MGPEQDLRSPGPLADVTVVDLSRMLPGAGAVRQLLDLGARVVKVEEPGVGDPLRLVPPLVDGVGVPFAALLRGVRSVELDLATERGARAVRRLARSADVLIESFRPGTLERWGLGRDELARINPALVVCSLPSWPSGGPCSSEVGHDLNFIARAGLLEQWNGDDLPPIQVADFTAGLLAATSIVAALLHRERTGRGSLLEQSLGAAVLPWVTLPWASAAAGGDHALGLLLGGAVPCYGLYTCGDGRRVAVGALEPKFWIRLVEMLGLPHLAGNALDTGEAVRREIREAFARYPARHWVDRAREAGLPLTEVTTLTGAMEDPCLRTAAGPGTVEFPGGTLLEFPGSWLGTVVSRARRVPALGEHTAEVLEEIGLGEAGRS